ncbi:MAG: dipeptidase [Bacteroidia bacterium]
MTYKHPVIDLHCDLLSYLEFNPGARPDFEKIGCSLPSLEKGNVKLQVMAIYSATEPGSSVDALRQSLIFKELLSTHSENLAHVHNVSSLEAALCSSKTGIVAAIENASGFCEEDEPLDKSFRKLETIIANTGRILYIGFTHHEENRFGGGNSSKAGLKEDGKALLDFLNGKKIAVDLSHTSDALAYGILDHISKHKLEIPVMASHSNFRAISGHARNLPDDIAKEIHLRKGIIGINFLRAFLNPMDADSLYEHIVYGIKAGFKESICFGADYFFAGTPDPARLPYYFKEHETAACYPDILQRLSEMCPRELTEGIGYKNAANFINRIWG